MLVDPFIIILMRIVLHRTLKVQRIRAESDFLPTVHQCQITRLFFMIFWLGTVSAPCWGILVSAPSDTIFLCVYIGCPVAVTQPSNNLSSWLLVCLRFSTRFTFKSQQVSSFLSFRVCIGRHWPDRDDQIQRVTLCDLGPVQILYIAT